MSDPVTHRRTVARRKESLKSTQTARGECKKSAETTRIDACESADVIHTPINHEPVANRR
jgi:hypothetical protein